MRPISLRFQCFGPYMQEQFIDFEELERDGIFLICGETGAGKTTILDAICYALYGRSSGGLRGGLEVMRCALAGSEDDTLVEFVFESNGKRYRFTRSLKYKTEKNKKSRNLNDYHNCMQLDGDREIPIIEKEQDRFVTQKAQELIGLTYDQFRQVIILPQGQFERLLVSDSEQKEEILVSLFHAQRWQQLADRIYEQVYEQDKALKEERLSMEELLRQYGCRNASELEEKENAQRRQLEEQLSLTQEAEQALEQAKKEKEHSLLENQAFQELKKRELRLAALKGREAQIASEESLLEDANRAETIAQTYREYCTAREAVHRGKISTREAEKTLAERSAALRQVQKQQMQQEALREEMNENRQRILLLRGAEESYQTLELHKEKLQEARISRDKAQIAVDRAQLAFQTSCDAFRQAIDCQNAAIGHNEAVQQQYLLGIGAVLAQKLKPGDPCPVCGSREHPAPAEQEQTHVTEEQVQAALDRMNAAIGRVSEQLAKRTQAEQEKQRAQQALAEARNREAIAETAYQQTLSNRLDGIDTEKQRKSELNTLEQKIQHYEHEDRQIQNRLTTALAGEETARNLLEAAGAALAQAQTDCEEKRLVWNAALRASGLETEDRYQAAAMPAEERQRRSAAVLQYRAELENAHQAVAEQQAVLVGKMAPDLTATARKLVEAEDRHRSCVTAQTLAAKALEDLQKIRQDLSCRMETYEKARVKVDSDLLFARRLRGDSGISLQRYVLGVMMTSVTVEANRLLGNVYRGRYRLYRTDEISGRRRKGGLELEVYDSHTNQRRSVTTLSGGEKFLVSLSLAIGLSAVVQAQGGGIRLEAMFVDEGFGSLDRESVSDALEVLQGVRRGSGIVGIISHVEQLTEVIPTRLEISKGKRGSICTLRN